MDLFIETPQRAAERLAREQQRQLDELRALSMQQRASMEAGAGLSAGSNGCDAAPAFSPHAGAAGAPGGAAGTAGAGSGQSAPPPCATGTWQMPASAFAPGTPAVAPAFAQSGVAHPGGDEYWQERAYDRRRQRASKLRRVLRVAIAVLLVPVILALVFVAAYALTCIMNGASPSELAELLGVMVERAGSFAGELLG